ncbi:MULTISPECIES: hypothetical protein [unclassified Ruegeria]|uniref:hypothetical protein n=1 Tax=unclassified Ruegeria TaxID=2625375 RepID=UPI00148781E9|nr:MULTISPECIES: hypothetical protein [unclassified Ruegeria]NOD37046.1 hypothetical protein [Ruegeria sp. HKCCD7296]NOD49859.1 hypothetical protein [Ruegeria sp. HKCCD5849]NOD54170.1 hypothetical protein [Ruegeria sp. HKCCD5851]NOD70232.1 hypothetical protein [Ruegeria sp. HKCCD7303]NOE34502.1 hypothetical protein [Ruegeria sp. HKCCD7318]
MDDYSECLDIARQELRLAQSALRKDIAEYPTPIAGCDEQFNHLLDQRERVRNALEALDKLDFVPTPRKLNKSQGIESR